MIKEYQVCTGGTESLSSSVNDLIFKGWQPFGNLSCGRGDFSQVMVKLEGNSSMIKEYTVLELPRDNVNDFIFKGWQPFGSITVLNYSCWQAMVKM